MERAPGSWFVPPEDAREIESPPPPPPALAPVDVDPATLLEEARWSVTPGSAYLGTGRSPEVDPIPVPLPAPSTVAALPPPARVDPGPAVVEASPEQSAAERLADLEAAIGAALVSPAVEPPAADPMPDETVDVPQAIEVDPVADRFFAEGDAEGPALAAPDDDPFLAPVQGVTDDPAWADAEVPDWTEASPVAPVAKAMPQAIVQEAPAPAAEASPPAPRPRPEVTTARRDPSTHHPVVRARVATVAARAAAWTVDGILLVCAVAGAVYAAARIAGRREGLGVIAHDPALLAAALAFGAVLGLVYVGLSTAAGGQTFGARLAGIRILDQRGAPPTVSRAFARAFAAALGVLACLVGLVWVLLDERGQALHDRVARTYVVES